MILFAAMSSDGATRMKYWSLLYGFVDDDDDDEVGSDYPLTTSFLSKQSLIRKSVKVW